MNRRGFLRSALAAVGAGSLSALLGVRPAQSALAQMSIRVLPARGGMPPGDRGRPPHPHGGPPGRNR